MNPMHCHHAHCSATPTRVRTNRRLAVLLIACAAATTSLTAHAAVIPAGLNPGDSYYLAFVTHDNRDATSSSIAVYDQFVTDQAAMNSALTGTSEGVTWRAIASVDGVNARDHALIEPNVPVYLLDGATKISDGFSDTWDGALDNDLKLTQFLAVSGQNFPWTGTNDDGTAAVGSTLGTSTPYFGVIQTTAANQWVNFNTISATTLFPLYGLSSKLTVVPEPSTLALAAFGLVGLAAWAWRRRASFVGHSDT